MTRILVILLLSSALLTGCGQAAGPTPELAASKAPQFSTDEDILAYYAEQDATKDLKAVDCVLADDNAYDLAGVVQYGYNEDVPCALMFVREGAVAYFCDSLGGSQYEPPEDSVPTYPDDGEVTFSMFSTKTDKALNCWGTFSNEDGNIDCDYNFESRS